MQHLSNLKGLKIDNTSCMKILNQLEPRTLKITCSNFAFSFKNDILNNCDPRFNLNFYILNSFDYISLRYRIKFSKLCQLYFRNSYIATKLEIYGLQNNFIFTNILSFYSINALKLLDLNSTIKIFYAQNINLNQNILDPTVFKSLYSLSFINTMHSLDDKIFKSFKNLKIIKLIICQMNFFQPRGLKRINSINQDLGVNLTDRNSVKRHENRSVYLYFSLHCENK